MTVQSIQVTAVQRFQEESGGLVLVDVREVNEFEELASPYAVNFPLSQLNVDTTLHELGVSLSDQKVPLYFICKSGRRSLKAAEEFINAGYENVFNVEGGMIRWQEYGLPIS